MFGLFKRRKPTGFDYKPRFYDPVKEDLENRLAKYKPSQGDFSDEEQIRKTKERIKYGFQNKGRTTYYSTKSEDRKSNYRLVVIVLILVMLTFMVLRSDKILSFLKVFSGE